MSVIVRPVRFTDDVEAMRRFLEVLGLRARPESERDGWTDMVAGAGMVALHHAASSQAGAAAGETHLSFEADDLDALATTLRAAGVPQVVARAEPYGRVLDCVDPLGDVIAVDGRPADLQGYRSHRAGPDPATRVMPVRFTDPSGPYGAYLEAFGLRRSPHADEYFAIHVGEGDAGQVGLHHVYDGELPINPSPAAVHLTFETTTALEDVRDRLIAAGHADAVVSEDEFVALVSVTDPDGMEAQIHRAAT